MRLLIISGSPRKNSHSRALSNVALEYAKKTKKFGVEILDLHKNPLESFQGFEKSYGKKTKKAIEALKNCDAFIISTPVYNASFSGAVKNIFEHSNYKSLKGKVASFIINAGGKKSFENVHAQLNSLMNYFSIFSNPKAVYISPEHFGKDNKVKDETVKERIHELVDSTLAIVDKLKS